MKEIGGFFDLTANHKAKKVPTKYLFNASRYALEFLLSKLHIKKLYVPHYMCHSSILPALLGNNIEPVFYNIDTNFLPQEKIKSNIPLFYINYFGLCDEQASLMSQNHELVILDYAQAYFSPIIKNVYAIKSPRKFFALPDGGELYIPEGVEIPYPDDLDEDISCFRADYLYQRIDQGASATKPNNISSCQEIAQSGVKIMSQLTKAMLERVDLEHIKASRRINYITLHNSLAELNPISFKLEDNTVPLVYPFYSKYGPQLRQYLIENKIFVAKYWPDINPDSKCSDLVENLLPIPCDQRYNPEDMNYIIKLIVNFKN